MMRDNGADGNNERSYGSGKERYIASWNPVYCVYGWPHLVWPGQHNNETVKCSRCGAERPQEPCKAISRQGNVCARPEHHDGCHEVYVDGDGRRWWGDVRDDPDDLAALLRFADLHSESRTV